MKSQIKEIFKKFILIQCAVLILILPGCSGGGREGLNSGEGVKVRVSLENQIGDPVPQAIIRFDDDQNIDGDALFEETDQNLYVNRHSQHLRPAFHHRSYPDLYVYPGGWSH